ncbi:MAG: periplasmic heavy metal sensor [Bacteroidota bacterium]
MGKQQKNWQKWAVPALVVVNLLFLAIMAWQQFGSKTKPDKRPGGRPSIKAFLEEELQLDDQQIQQYESLIKEKRQRGRQHHARMRQLMQRQAQLLSEGADEAQLHSIADEIGQQHTQLIKANQAHFMEIGAILRPEQQEKWRSLLKEVLLMLGPGGPPHRDGPPPGRGPRP